MLVSPTEVTLGHRNSAVGTVPEFDTGIATGRKGADEFLPMLDIVQDNKVRTLKEYM